MAKSFTPAQGTKVEALHGKPFDRLSGPRKTALIARFQHDVFDHMPIWIRLPKPG